MRILLLVAVLGSIGAHAAEINCTPIGGQVCNNGSCFQEIQIKDEVLSYVFQPTEQEIKMLPVSAGKAESFENHSDSLRASWDGREHSVDLVKTSDGLEMAGVAVLEQDFEMLVKCSVKE